MWGTSLSFVWAGMLITVRSVITPNVEQVAQQHESLKMHGFQRNPIHLRAGSHAYRLCTVAILINRSTVVDMLNISERVIMVNLQLERVKS